MPLRISIPLLRVSIHNNLAMLIISVTKEDEAMADLQFSAKFVASFVMTLQSAITASIGV
jgi:hypothetical protein